MSRITSTVLVMLLLLNGTVAITEASGLNNDWGIEVTTGVDKTMDSLVSEMKQGFSPNVNIIQSFVSLAIAGVRVFQLIVETVYVAPQLMINLFGGGSLVSTFVYVIMAPMYMISTLEILYMATGNDMV